jgi:hypothetical protein
MAANDSTAPEAGGTKAVGSDDYALSRVPRDKRLGFWTMLLQWLAQSGSISQFTLGATIGVGMSFGDAFLAFTLGAVILEVVIFAIGLAGMREGLATPLLTRWASSAATARRWSAWSSRSASSAGSAYRTRSSVTACPRSSAAPPGCGAWPRASASPSW